jgi:tetratricopeptide (TPR) repeat protein
MHLTAGYIALTRGDFRVDPSHPPLARMWAAMPLVFSDVSADTTVIDRTPDRDWLTAGYGFARTFVAQRNIDAMLMPARAMVVWWGVALGLLLFAWAYEWLGPKGAIIALVLYTLSPNLAAHAMLVTTDAALACFVFGAVYSLWRYSRRPSRWNAAAVAACTALAFVTKFSALVLAPVLLALLALAIVRGTIRSRHAALLATAIIAATFLAVWAVYGFRYAPSSNPDWLLRGDAIAGRVGAPWLVTLLEWMDVHRLLPNAFAQGLVFSVASARELPAFLAGEVRPGGWWYYFPVAVALKTPLSILILSLAGSVMAIRQPRDARATAAFVLLPVVIWLAVAAMSGVNLGVRHVLPLYPFAMLLAALAGVELLARRGTARAALALAAVVLAIEVGRSEPYPISFFNTLAGGPENGYRYLADSNLAWGGNLKALKRWMEESDVESVNLAYFGSVDPAIYGIRAAYLPTSATFLADRIGRPQLPGYVAISGTALDGVYLPPWWRRFYSGFRDRVPVAVVGNSMRVFWVDRWPEPADRTLDPESLRTLADGLLFGLRWPEHAMEVYDEYLQYVPGDAAAWNGRSVALAQTGRPAEALEGFRRVLALSPSDPNVRQNIALLEQQVTRAWPVRE